MDLIRAEVRQGDFVVTGVFERLGQSGERLELREISVRVEGELTADGQRMRVAKLSSRSIRTVNLKPLFEVAYRAAGLKLAWPHTGGK